MSYYGRAWDAFVSYVGGERVLAGYPYQLAQKAFGAGYAAGMRFNGDGMPDGARKTQCQYCGWTFGTHARDCDRPAETQEGGQ